MLIFFLFLICVWSFFGVIYFQEMFDTVWTYDKKDLKKGLWLSGPVVWILFICTFLMKDEE